jgi:predicted adenylyl cyclase CyaB
MPDNVELKARYPDHDQAQRILRELGARPGGTERQIDTYFEVKNGRLKLREIEGRDSELIYYRRVEDGSRRECRYLLYRHPPCETLKELLASALEVLCTVRKTREVYHLGEVKFNLDDVVDLGRFIEFEVRADASGVEGAQKKLVELRGRFGVGEEQVVLCSYSDMVG